MLCWNEVQSCFLLAFLAVAAYSVSDAQGQGNLFTCKTPAIADIVILVDGSWSIGRFNFRLVRLFLENLVSAFNVGSEKTRVGLAQYSGDPRIEWHLNAYGTKDAVLDAVRNLPYKGGNTLTGLALTYILENSFKPEAGARPGVSKIGILITDGKSQDDVIPPAKNLRDAGIELFAIGVKNADINELKEIASEPDSTHVYNVADFNFMNSIVEGLTRTVCSRVEEQEKEIKGTIAASLGAPTDLVTSDITARGFRVSWTHSPGKVEKYRVVYYPTRGGQPEEVVVDGSSSTAVLKNLMSLTEYQIAVFAIYSNAASEGLRGTETTRTIFSVYVPKKQTKFPYISPMTREIYDWIDGIKSNGEALGLCPVKGRKGGQSEKHYSIELQTYKEIIRDMV